MAHLQYMPGDPRLVDQLVYELKSKGIFDQFRKECIADVDTRPAYQNLRQRVESSVTTFLTRQTWKADLNKNQLREKLRKHILDGNYLEQGVERIVDQVVNPKVTSVFIPQVEDLVYNYLGIPRKKNPVPEVPETKDLHLEDLEAVSPGSVKSNDEESKEKVEDMDIDSEGKNDTETMNVDQKDELVEVSSDSASMDKSSIPLPSEEIKLENIPAPENSPTLAKVDLENIELPKEPSKPVNIELKNIELPKEPNLSTDIPLPDEVSTSDETTVFKPLVLQSDESNSSSSSSIRRNMSPITPIRNFDDDSCDAQQAFENNSSDNNHKDPSSFTFNIENKDSIDSSEIKPPKKDSDLSYQFTNQVNINTYNTPMYDDSSNSHNLQIDYESDANTNTSKTAEVKQEAENNDESKKEKKDERKSSSHKSSHRSRDSSRHSSSKDKHSNSRDSSRHEKKSSSKDDKSKSSKEREKSKDRGDKKDSSSSKQRSSHKSSSSSSKDKHRSSNSSHRHSSKSSDDRKTSKDSKDKTSEKDKDRSSEKDRDRKESSSRDRKDSKSSHRDKDRKSSSRKDKDKKKDKKDTDDHYSSSGRGNHSRRSTDRDSNDGSSSSKGSQNQNNSKSTSDSKKESKNGSKSENTSTSTSETTSPSDKQQIVTNTMQFKPIIRVDKNLETPIANPPRLPFVPDVTLRKPKFANNFEEAKKMMKMRKFLAEEQKRMNQEAALLLEFQANVRPSMSQVYSSIPGPELEFACVTHTEEETKPTKETVDTKKVVEPEVKIDTDTKFSLITVSDLIETKHVTKDIINDIIGVPIDDENSEVNEITITLELEELKEEPIQEIDDVKKFIKPTDKTVDPLEESIAEIVDQNMSTEVELTVSETLSEADVSDILETKEEVQIQKPLQYFAEHEKFTAELEKHKFGSFLKQYIENNDVSNKMYLMNCDTYEENIVKEIAATFGDYEIVNYHKNGHLVPNKNILHASNEVSLPLETNDFDEKSPLFSPVKSECSFELSSDYDAKLNDMVNKKSRQEVMEIILGGMLDESTTKMPTIDYYTEMSDSENNLTIVEEPIEVEVDSSMKRRISEEVDENKEVFIPNKMRKISDSDQISSTTEETEEISNNNKIQTMRSQYLGRAKRVGLPRPKKCTQPNSPSSDKSVENYVQNTPTANGKLKTPRSKVQRYDTSDLYKPKLHYLSRRNNIS